MADASTGDDLTGSLCELLDVAPQTAEEVWTEFFPRLIGLARKRLADLPCRDFDAEDVAQSALKSFFRGQQEDRFGRLTSRDEMWRLLATITARKVTRQRRRMMADKRGGGDVRGESVFLRPGSGEDSTVPGLGGISGGHKMPETIEEILQTCGDLLEQLPDDKLRRTAIMRLEGYSNQEIADELNCSVARTKQRLQRIRELWGDEAGTV